MIKDKKDLKRYLLLEKGKIKIKYPIIQWASNGELYSVYNFFSKLRHLEYYTNINKKWYHYIPYIWYKWNHRRLKLKYNIFIEPNCLGEGALFVHPGFIRIGEYVRIGKNCTMLPNVLIGKKNPNNLSKNITIGDNCYIGTGATILGPVKIGNNVSIAAGSVVTRDIPDNSTVVGIPAKLL